MKKLLLILSIFLPLSTYGAGISDFSPVSHWDCDETSGVRYDANLTNTNDLTDNNTVLYQAGSLSNACDFERSNSEYLSITDGNQLGLDVSTNATFSFWINIETLPSTGQIYPMVSKIGTANNESYSLYLYNDSGTHKIAMIGAGDGIYGGPGTYWLTNWTPTVATWYHIAFTYDASIDKTTWYINGSSYASSTTAYTENLFYNGASPFQIGADVGWNNAYFDGLIDEISVFSATLTASEISTLYNSGTPLPYTDTTPLASTSTATSTVNMSDTNFMLAVIIFFLMFIFLGLAFSTVNNKKR